MSSHSGWLVGLVLFHCPSIASSSPSYGFESRSAETASIRASGLRTTAWGSRRAPRGTTSDASKLKSQIFISPELSLASANSRSERTVCVFFLEGSPSSRRVYVRVARIFGSTNKRANFITLGLTQRPPRRHLNSALCKSIVVCNQR
jgi:hypothetical protein